MSSSHGGGNDEKEKVYKNGKDYFIATFRTQAPVDVLIISLGTNDLQLKYNKDYMKIISLAPEVL